MVLISYNINGIRAATKKALFDWLLATHADIVGFQEVKAQQEQVDLNRCTDAGYHIFWNSAEKKGYSGVAVLSKHQPFFIENAIGDKELDQEGRVLILHFKNTIVFNAYFPAGSNEKRMLAKIRFLHFIQLKLDELAGHNKSIVIMGDLNIAHTEKDVFNPVYALNAAGFTSGERHWLSQLIESGYVDTFRALNPQVGQYSWWSYMGRARAKNLGWRIDYILSRGEINRYLSRSQLLTEAHYSDHCPVRTEFAHYSI